MKKSSIKKLLKKYFNITYLYDYDYYDIYIALNVTKEEYEVLKKYNFFGEDERGSEVCIFIEEIKGIENRVLINLYAEFFQEKLHGKKFPCYIASSDYFLRFISNIYEDLQNHDYGVLYTFIKHFGTQEDLEGLEKPKQTKNIELMNYILKD